MLVVLGILQCITGLCYDYTLLGIKTYSYKNAGKLWSSSQVFEVLRVRM